MDTRRRTKLARLQHLLPAGLIADAAWFTRMGYPSSLRSRYLAGGWLEPVARGVFRRPQYQPGLENVATPLHWQHVVVSLQMVMGYSVSVGGRTALDLHGYTHYIPMAGTRKAHLYSDGPLPGWLRKLPIATSFVCHNAAKVVRAEPIAVALDSVKADMATDHVRWSDPIHGSLTSRQVGDWGWPFVLSTPERAALELLDELPGNETFHDADMLLEGMMTPSTIRLNQLLADCRSVKVKRLFLWFAERHNQPWLEDIDVGKIDLGRGKRMLVRGGKLDPKYQITVPGNLDAGG